MINDLGMYVQADGDVGDATHRTGLASGLNALLGNHEKAQQVKETLIKNCEVYPGIWTRHPGGYQPTWTNQTTNMSRDQVCRVMFAMAVLGEKSVIKRWLLQMAKRGFLHQNNCDPTNGSWRPRDVMTVGEWRNIIRGLNLWILYPILVLFDMAFLIEIPIRSKWDGGSMLYPDIHFATKKFPTPFAFLAKHVIKKTPCLDEVMNNHDPIYKNGCVELQLLFKSLSDIY